MASTFHCVYLPITTRRLPHTAYRYCLHYLLLTICCSPMTLLEFLPITDDAAYKTFS